MQPYQVTNILHPRNRISHCDSETHRPARKVFPPYPEAGGSVVAEVQDLYTLLVFSEPVTVPEILALLPVSPGVR